MSSLPASGMMQRFSLHFPASWPVQLISVEVTLKSPPTPSTFPGGGRRREPSLLGMRSVVVFAVSSHNLVSRDRKIGVQCVYYTRLDYCIRCRRIYPWFSQNYFRLKIFSPVQPLFSFPVPRSACFPRRFFVLRSIRPFPQPWSLVPGYHKGNDSEDEYCPSNLLKTFVMRIILAEQRRTFKFNLSTTFLPSMRLSKDKS